MLDVYFGWDEDSIRDIDVFFRNVYESKWFEDEIVKRMIADIDHSEVKSAYVIESPVLGQITPDMISGGVKTLICLYKMEDISIDLITCGDNCEDWLVELSHMNKKIKVSLSGHDLLFYGKDIQAICRNDGSSIKNGKDWFIKMSEFVCKDLQER